MKEKKDVRPVLLKFGVAVALSLGGILYSFFRNKRIRPSQSPPSPSPPPSDSDNQVGSEGEAAAGRKSNFSTTSIAPVEHDSCPPTDDSVIGISPSCRSDGDKDGFLLPEFDELVKEFDRDATKAYNSTKKDVETVTPDTESPTADNVVKKDHHEQEIKSLRNTVKILKERERALEIQLLEYYGLKEQEAAVMELHNRLKIKNMESKFFTLKIESLQADNRRLKAQVTDYAKVVGDLEAARASIKLLKRKLRSGAEQNKEQILALQERVTKLQEHEQMAVGNNREIQLNLEKLKDLEEEVEELRKSNYKLQLENSDLGQRLDYAQLLATSVVENEETEALKEESQQLKKQNEDLTKEIERLQEGRCADVEELVYMRWINACLRYELRNYQPGPGETAARDLSKTLSPKSEEKAKQLILEYANKEGLSERGINSTEFDSDHSSCSRASYLTDSGDFDDSSVDNLSTGRTNTSSRKKVFGKLIKLLRGEGHHHSQDSTDSAVYNSGVQTEGQNSNKSRISSLSSSRRSLESSRLSLDAHKSPYFRKLKTEKTDSTSNFEGGRKSSDDAGSFSGYKNFVSISDDVDSYPQENQLNKCLENNQKANLMKYAEALSDNRGKTSKFRRRSESFASFGSF